MPSDNRTYRTTGVIAVCLIAIFMIVPIDLSAYIGDYDGILCIEPATVNKDDSFHFECKGEDVVRQRIEVGVHPLYTGKIDWTLKLNDATDAHSVEINVRKDERNKYDFNHDECIVITLFIDGKEMLTKDFGNRLPISKSPIYMRIQSDGKEIALSAGAGKLESAGSVAYNGFFSNATVSSAHDISLDRYSSLHIPKPLIPQIYPDVAAVEYALSNCNDSRCAIWEYYDEEVETRIALKGGRYKFALLPSEKGGYDIIYLSGAEVDPFRWSAGALKGRLIPTPFSDTFTLYWIDSAGKEIADLTPYATFDGIIMSLVFPIQKAKFRFVRSN